MRCSNGVQTEALEAQGIQPHVPANRSIDNQGDGPLFDRRRFTYDADTDTYRCPAGQTLVRKQRMADRATPEAMRRRRCMVEHPFAALKCRIFGYPRFRMRGIAGARAEMAIATLVWNLKRAMRVLGEVELGRRLAAA